MRQCMLYSATSRTCQIHIRYRTVSSSWCHLNLLSQLAASNKLLLVRLHGLVGGRLAERADYGALDRVQDHDQAAGDPEQQVPVPAEDGLVILIWVLFGPRGPHGAERPEEVDAVQPCFVEASVGAKGAAALTRPRK